MKKIPINAAWMSKTVTLSAENIANGLIGFAKKIKDTTGCMVTVIAAPLRLDNVMKNDITTMVNKKVIEKAKHTYDAKIRSNSKLIYALFHSKKNGNLETEIRKP